MSKITGSKGVVDTYNKAATCRYTGKEQRSSLPAPKANDMKAVGPKQPKTKGM